ncbi:ATP-dependent RNA helicase RhlE [Sinomicrobium oceani]|uniref:ATP-dependent RNA helicase RhlE n=1 Tax=Sinomicrobium oceani TaxID=1150368 RepID=A0A1K1RP10_9FLAO|nr:DEAD/DEAH box helicase [Sinomicrobium oceani]SFW73995.1 ATP-dependent RNA helicase RhlE [Sinomicrobium oceani]
MNYKKKINTKNTSVKRRPPVKKGKASSLSPQDLLQHTSKLPEPSAVPFVAKQAYAEMDLHPMLLKNLQRKGYTHPTEIQEKTLISLVNGDNLIGIASTGTGKTGAFLIPIVQQLLTTPNTRYLVVVPTRELALQVHEEFQQLNRSFGFSSVCFIGGTSVGKDVAKARHKNHLIISTPGRLLDLVGQKALRLQNISGLVLDEFDRMLDMGFIQSVQTIVSLMTSRKQTMLFSATIKPGQEKLIHDIVPGALTVKASSGTESSSNVKQNMIKVSDGENKFDVLHNLLKESSFKKVILFAETKRTVDKINKQLAKAGIHSDVIHGNKSQNYRTRAITLFKSGKIRVLVATDVAARGIDVDNVTHVINYQMPQSIDSYIHRIGRTGRAGKQGMAYTFIN